MKSKFTTLCLFSFVMLLPVCGFSATLFLTNKQFDNRGDGFLIGQITSVQVVSSEGSSESGTVQLNVTRVLSGTLNASTVTLSYERALLSFDDPSNWDLLKPTNVSLQKFGVGRSILVHFMTDSEGNVSIAPASNSVQDASEGLLLGVIQKIKWQDPARNDSAWHLQLKVNEVIFGWVSEAEIDLPCSGPLDHHLEGREVIVVFEKSGIRSVKPATPDFLAQLQQADTQ